MTPKQNIDVHFTSKENDETRDASPSWENHILLPRINIIVVLPILVMLSIGNINRATSVAKSSRRFEAADTNLINSRNFTGTAETKSKSNDGQLVLMHDWVDELPACQIRVTNKVA